MGINIVDNKLEIDHIIKHLEFLGKQNIANEIIQLLCKYKYGNHIHQHGKQ